MQGRLNVFSADGRSLMTGDTDIRDNGLVISVETEGTVKCSGSVAGIPWEIVRSLPRD